MLKGGGRKLAAALCCLLLVTVMNFLLPRLMPGDPVLMLTGLQEGAVSAEQYAAYSQRLGLDQPVGQQLLDYMTGLLRGDLGYSYHRSASVGSLIAGRLPATLLVALPALLLSALLAVTLGGWAGLAQGSRWERGLTAVMLTLDAIPGFLLAMAAVYLFGFILGWLPLGGLAGGVEATLWERLQHLLLPVWVVALGSLPGKYLLVRGSVAAQLSEKYPAYARARGLSGHRVLYRHIFPNACRPFIAMLGVNLGFVLSGSMVVETIFSIKGMGNLLYQSVQSRDLPTLQGCLLVTAVAVVGATLLADGALWLLEPRERRGYHAR